MMEVIAGVAAVVGLVLVVAKWGKRVWWWALTPMAGWVQLWGLAANKWFHARRAAAIRHGARMRCTKSGCKRVVGMEDAERIPWLCAPCTRDIVKQKRDAIYADVPMWWTDRGRCLKCGHEYTIACPQCHAPGKLPVFPLS